MSGLAIGNNSAFALFTAVAAIAAGTTVATNYLKTRWQLLAIFALALVNRGF